MQTTRRTFLQSIGATSLTAALTGCDAASDALATLLDPQPQRDFRPPAANEIDLSAHVLNRLTYGARPGEYARVQAMGPDAFIEEQLDYENIGDRAAEWKAAQVESMYQATPELYDIPAQQLLGDMIRHRLLRGVYSKRQLYEIMVEFWTDHFNIVSDKGDCKWLKAADDREVIRAHALGSFPEMLRASALSPAMLIYLDGHDNKVERPGDRPNENYARELLELHTLGVHGGYTQKDVMEVARCLSGWTFRRKAFQFRSIKAEFVPARHDNGAKIVLGERIAAGGGPHDLDRVIEIVCNHPSTAEFIATKLCRRFITDPAPHDAIETVAIAFRASNGNIKDMLRALFNCDYFRAARGNLFKRPMHYVISALRATDAKTDAGPPIAEYLQRMGHMPFQYPTPDGYPLEEQPWLGTLLWRWNFAIALESGRLDGTEVEVDSLAARFDDAVSAAAHLLGRAPTPLEMDALSANAAPLALMLASPAFQRY